MTVKTRRPALGGAAGIEGRVQPLNTSSTINFQLPSRPSLRPDVVAAVAEWVAWNRGQPLLDGDKPLTEECFEIIASNAFCGEDVNETVLRLIAMAEGRGGRMQ
jgi:hypothetical protein